MSELKESRYEIKDSFVEALCSFEETKQEVSSAIATIRSCVVDIISPDFYGCTLGCVIRGFFNDGVLDFKYMKDNVRIGAHATSVAMLSSEGGTVNMLFREFLVTAGVMDESGKLLMN